MTNTSTPTPTPLVIDLTASVAQPVYQVGDLIEVCWNTDPDDVPFTVTISTQAPAPRTVNGPFPDRFDAGCARFEALDADVGAVTIVVQAAAPSGATATVSLNTTVREVPR